MKFQRGLSPHFHISQRGLSPHFLSPHFHISPKITEHATNKVIVGTPTEIYQMFSKAPAGTYRS